MKRLGAFLLALISTAAFAAGTGTADLSWVNPTQYSDGSSLPVSEIQNLKIMYGKCPDGQMPTTVTAIAVPKAGGTLPTSLTVTGLDNGSKYCYAMSTVSVSNGESVRSNVAVSTTGPHAPPLPPSGLTVTALTVYMEVRSQNRFALVAVGTVPPDTACDPTQSVNGFYAVPVERVSWSGNVRPPVVVAKCS